MQPLINPSKAEQNIPAGSLKKQEPTMKHQKTKKNKKH